MESIGTSVATKVAETLVDKAMKEAHYLCCFKSYVEDFQKEKIRLSAAVESLHEDIKEAENRNEHRIDPRVRQWLDEANGLIQEGTKARKKCFFGLFTDCYWQHQQGKELERKKQEIPKLIEDSKGFVQVARSTGLPGIKYHSSPDFIHFESRKSKFEELKEALKDENNHKIGLQGMGGTGKTTIAIELGKEVEQSKLFDKVIFTVVSNPPNIKTIRNDIASHLGLPLKEEESGSHAEKLWATLANSAKKVLIILDDIWDKELDLKLIGIPVGRHEKGCCSVLLTTRDVNVCKEMKCHKTIQLELLSEEDTLNLLLSHANNSGDGSSNDFKDVGLNIVKECGRLPVAIVAVAKALYLEPLEEWKEALTRLKNPYPFKQDNVDENMTKVYNSLRLSHDNLKNKEAQELFLLCSLFPEDYGIPIELLSRIAIGLGHCGDVDKYSIARSQVPVIKKKLINSSLLLKAEEECVKIHDLVREVAHSIASTKIQVIMDSKTALKENIQYSSWNIDHFPNCFGGSKLEFLLVWVNTNDDFVEVPNALFNGMMGLRVLILICTYFKQIAALSLMQSILSLRNIRTLFLKNWELGDISIVKNIRCLETFELSSCSIIELPNEVTQLEKLRLLRLTACTIEWNNPFKVIARCPRLEELYYAKNSDTISRAQVDELPQNITLPQLERYHIVAPWSVDIHKVDFSISRCFDPCFCKNILSEETFKFMATKTTVLQSRGSNETRWKNLIPDIIRMEDGGMKDLIRLSLDSWSKIECLINTEHLQSDVTIFFKLVELELINVNLKELCCGPLPIDFLKKLRLKDCSKLESTLFKGRLDLGKLKSIYLRQCSMTSLFHPSTAQSLKQLEKLDISTCSELEYIITKDDKYDPSQKGQGTMFPKLKVLNVSFCDKLEFILPICFAQDLSLLEDVTIYCCQKLKYICGQYTDEGSLSQKEKEITLPSLTELSIAYVPNLMGIYPEWYHPMSYGVQDSSTIAGHNLKAKCAGSPTNTFSWSHICCFQLKSNATIIDNLTDCTGSEGSKKEWDFNIAKCLLRPTLNPCKLRKMRISVCSNLTSLFTLQNWKNWKSHGAMN